MKNLLSKIVRGVLVASVALSLASPAFAAAALGVAPPPMTGPCSPNNGTTCNPAQQPQNLGDYNGIILEIMNWAGSWLVFNTLGEAQFLGASSFAANGTVATTMTSLGPIGSHTTIQEWLAVLDPAGTVRYIPTY